eukprot:Tbor_TRINITY_DN3460_c0_g1::TRINITY_DN3460_c0_g1_i1::g.3795::m.3795/K15730/PTGES3; cytosolic prostaglandin-E synthase
MSQVMSSNHVRLSWAQRLHTVLIVVDVIKPTNVKIEFLDSEGKSASDAAERLRISYSTISTEEVAERQFSEEILLFQSVTVPKSNVHVTERCIYIRLAKVDAGSFWTRIYQNKEEHKRKAKHVTVNWSLWKDEDELIEEKEEEEFSNVPIINAFKMSNGVSMHGGGDPNVIANMLRNAA